MDKHMLSLKQLLDFGNSELWAQIRESTYRLQAVIYFPLFSIISEIKFEFVTHQR